MSSVEKMTLFGGKELERERLELELEQERLKLEQERLELVKSMLICPIPYDDTKIEVTKNLSVFHREVEVIGDTDIGDIEIENNDSTFDLEKLHKGNVSQKREEEYEYPINLNRVKKLLSEHLKMLSTQKLLTYAFDNLISLKEKEFNEYNWEDGSRAIWDQMYGYPFVSKSNSDYYIIFGNTMTHFITDEFWNKLIFDALINLKNIKREDIKLNTDVRMHFITYLLETDCNPPNLLYRFPKNPRKLIKVMVKTYRNYFDVGHLDFGALSIATKRCLLAAIQKAINTYEGDPYRSILC